jgi:hypothetical protein
MQMKFTDGFWQMRNGVTSHYPAQVHDVKIESEALTIYAPTKKLESRGDTLNLSLLTILKTKKNVRVEISNLTGSVETIFDVQREADVIKIKRQGLSKAWKVLLVNVHSVKTNEANEKTFEGILITPMQSTNGLEIKVLPE